MAISDSGVVKEVHQLCVKLYAIKELTTLVSDEARVGMHHVGRARVKKEKQEINVTPFVNGNYFTIYYYIIIIYFTELT